MSYTINKDDNGILQVVISGDFTEEELITYMHDISEIMADLPEDEKIQTFIDTTELGRVNPNLRRSVGDFLDDQRFGKTAVLGSNRVVKVMIDFVLKASGRQHMKYFTDRNEAETWLLDSNL